MSNDDDPSSWFDGSSNSADETSDTPSEHHLEAVPASTSESMTSDWFDQDMSGTAAPTSSSAASRSSNAGAAKALFVGVVLVVLLVLAGGAWVFASLLGGSESSSAAPLTVPSTPTATTSTADETKAAAAGDCQSTESSAVITGNGKGDSDSVAGVVLAFQHAYYVDRDAKKMKPLLSKDSKITDLDALQEGIDSVERGTTHCLKVTPERDDSASVELTEIATDGTETTYTQRVTTTSESGDVRIVSIEDKS